ncbi:unnamed protein product [Schistosoma margrebowiei]|uniref:Uncharacterized protein n=1 Tax=Schistosoma margrebowiei TaxID=48269 RepID=A0A183LIL8_9TREM|nr:unnamed protein product [Schistosoma margrebowiei]
MNVIQFYAPTGDSDGDDKDQFHEAFIDHSEVNKKLYDILKGDLNNKVGMDINKYGDIMGRHEVEKSDEISSSSSQEFVERNKVFEVKKENFRTINKSNNNIININIDNWNMKLFDTTS